MFLRFYDITYQKQNFLLLIGTKRTPERHGTGFLFPIWAGEKSELRTSHTSLYDTFALLSVPVVNATWLH